jgi:hypothetical protein
MFSFSRRSIAIAASTLALAATACGSSSTTTTGTTGAGGGSTSATTSTGTGGGECTSKMYAKYGDAAFTQVSKDIVAAAAADAKMAPFFKSLDTQAKADAFIASLANFLVYVYGGPNNYKGPDMVTAHKGLMISSDDYDYFVGLIVGVLTKDGVSADDIMTCFAPPVVDPAFKASIVGK